MSAFQHFVVKLKHVPHCYLCRWSSAFWHALCLSAYKQSNTNKAIQLASIAQPRRSSMRSSYYTTQNDVDIPDFQTYQTSSKARVVRCNDKAALRLSLCRYIRYLRHAMAQVIVKQTISWQKQKQAWVSLARDPSLRIWRMHGACLIAT